MTNYKEVFESKLALSIDCWLYPTDKQKGENRGQRIHFTMCQIVLL